MQTLLDCRRSYTSGLCIDYAPSSWFCALILRALHPQVVKIYAHSTFGATARLRSCNKDKYALFQQGSALDVSTNQQPAWNRTGASAGSVTTCLDPALTCRTPAWGHPAPTFLGYGRLSFGCVGDSWIRVDLCSRPGPKLSTRREISTMLRAR